MLSQMSFFALVPYPVLLVVVGYFLRQVHQDLKAIRTELTASLLDSARFEIRLNELEQHYAEIRGEMAIWRANSSEFWRNYSRGKNKP